MKYNISRKSFANEWLQDLAQLHRFLEKCSRDTHEVLLACRLGLEGVECLEACAVVFREKGTVVCAIVNEVSNKHPLEENECKYISNRSRTCHQLARTAPRRNRLGAAREVL